MDVLGIMPLGKFFGRFDSARDKLRAMAFTGVDSAETEVRINKLSLGWYQGTLYLDRAPSEQVVAPFRERKGDVKVCYSLGLCRVPSDLMRDIRFVERAYDDHQANSLDNCFRRVAEKIDAHLSGGGGD